jgi:TolB-like protein/Tfp pilus assembly protein PilF/predicted Ser/Thr protein kinase
MSLSASQMARLSNLLDEALELSVAARGAWLDALSPEDQALLHTLRDSLMVHDAASAIDAPVDALPCIDAVSNGHGAGQRVGSYELLRPLGSGGMADVWLARRADGIFDRQVAVKFPRMSHVPAEMAERFARECKILAGLEYPGIARLYDAGVTAGGMPYIAMEYVQGTALTEYCEANGLDAAGRISIFLQVLDAVGYAHAQQVIHRDLKPSNILVTEQGQVRLLDFGIARLLEDQPTDRPSVTRAFGRALTPEYASPELLRGDPIDVRSDIYSLGIVLHELLTGRRPGKGAAGASVTRAAEPGSETGTVVQKALASNPDERYADAASFSAALRRLLPGDQPLARAEGSGRRGRIAAIAAIVLVAIAALAIVRYRNQTARPEVALDRPAQATAAPVVAAAPPAIAVLPFMDLSEHRDQGYLSDGLAEELVSRLTKIRELRVTARASSFAFRDQPDDIPSIAKKLNVDHILEGSVRKSGQRLRVSVQLVKASTGTSIWSETYDREDIFEVQEDVASAVVKTLKIQLLAAQGIPADERTQNVRAYEEYLLGRQFQEGYALERQMRAKEAFERAVKLDPLFAPAHAGIALAAANIGEITGKLSWFDTAESAAEQAMALAPRLTEAYVARAVVRMARDWDWTGARTDFDTALGLDPNNAALLQNYGEFLSYTGRYKEGLVIKRRAVEQNPMFSTAWDFLALGLMEDKDFAGARQAFDRAQELSPYNDFRTFVRASMEVKAGNYAEAVRLARQNSDPNQRDHGLALAEFSLGHAAEARAALQRLVARAPNLYAVQIAEAYAWQGDKEQAFKWLDRAVKVHDQGLKHLFRNSWTFASLQDDPRFDRVLEKMHLSR